MTNEALLDLFRIVWSYASHHVRRDAPELAKQVEELLYGVLRESRGTDRISRPPAR
jgi:hypothetical protein